MTTVLVGGWREGVRKTSVTKVLRVHGGLTPHAARWVVNNVVGHRAVHVDVADARAGRRLVDVLTAVGVRAEVHVTEPLPFDKIDNAIELRNLERNVTRREWAKLNKLPLVDYRIARCPRGEARDVLARVREVLGVVLRQRPRFGSRNPKWRKFLPQWFRDRLVDDLRPKRLYRPGRTNPRWSLTNWLEYFAKSNREWRWVAAHVPDPSTLEVLVASYDFIFPSEALDGLLIVAGAMDIDYE